MILLSKEELSKKHKKTLLVLTIVTISIATLIFIGGIVTDIVYWGCIYPIIRDPNVPGHGVPVFSFFGILLAIVFSLIMGFVFLIVRLKQKKEMKRIQD